ncbi:TPA: hypothetical protein DIC20_03135 [Candidatus Dependentiae bacterium]|nr:hypothetical protein [Candidatus Dependentiae bacterium]HCU00670.1 hypothetical protein [Candidatus Dependentiae bacterium]
MKKIMLIFIYVHCLFGMDAESVSSEICDKCHDRIVTTLPCGHKFHPKCIGEWCNSGISRVLRCPCCRGSIHKYPTIEDRSKSIEVQVSNTKEMATQTDPVTCVIPLCALCSLFRRPHVPCYWYCDYVKDNLEPSAPRYWGETFHEIACRNGGPNCCLLSGDSFRHVGAFLFSDHGICFPYCCIKKTPCWEGATKKWSGLSPYERTLIRCCLFCPFFGPFFTDWNKEIAQEELKKGKDVKCDECPYCWPELFEKEISMHAE